MAADPAPKTKAEPGPHADHRARMRARVERCGFDSLAEHEALEYVLFFALPRRNTNPLAHALLDRFGSFARVLDASEEELCSVEGIGPAAAHFLHTLHQVNQYYLLSRGGDHKRMETTEKVVNYLMPQFLGARQERLAMLAFDDRQRLLRLVWLDDGTAGSVDISVRRITNAAAMAGAAGVILAHNHPDGTTLPSREDITSTQMIGRALSMIGVRLTDHLILAGTEYLSLRDSGRMPRMDAPCP